MKLQFEELEINEEMMSDTETRAAGIFALVCGVASGVGLGMAIAT